MRASIARWGNSLGIRIPQEIARPLALREGSRVEIVAEGDRVVISPIRRRPRYALKDLLVGMTPDAVRDAFEWGPEIGREDVP